MTTLSRAHFLKIAAAATAGAILTSCSTGTGSQTDGAAQEGQSYTVKHAFGQTTFDTVPQRIAVVQFWINPDALLALDVVPVGSPAVTWGGNANQSTPWFDAKRQELGAEEPVRYQETDGPDYQQLAQLEPDAIFCPYGEMSQEVYDKLSQVAPVVPAPEGVGSWATSWQQALEMAGKMLQKEEEAQRVIQETEEKIKAKASEYQNLKGASFLAGAFNSAENTFGAYTSQDTRPRFFSLLGMEQAAYVKDRENEDKTSFFIDISAEVIDTVQADAVWAWVDQESMIEQIKSNKLFANIPALKNDALVFEADKTLGLALSASSSLSLIWALEKTDILKNMSQAVEKTRQSAQ